MHYFTELMIRAYCMTDLYSRRSDNVFHVDLYIYKAANFHSKLLTETTMFCAVIHRVMYVIQRVIST